MRMIVVLVLFYLANLSVVQAADDKDSRLQAKGIMGSAHEAFVKILPYVYSKDDSLEVLKQDPKKKAELLKNLEDLSNVFTSAKHIEFLQRPGFRPTLDTMNSHLADTVNAITYSNYPFAQKRLTALTTLCISCHSQLTSGGSEHAFENILNKSKRENFDSDYSYGNYLFLVRDFAEAEKYLINSINSSLKESRSRELYSSLRRVISINTKISFNYEKAKKFTEKYSTEKQMPKLAKQMVLAWDKSLLSWQKFDPGAVKDISQFISTHLRPLEEMNEVVGQSQNDIALLISSGILSKYLNDNPKAENAPEILYWLSIAERNLSDTFYFTLSDLYLKDCIKQYSKSPFAKKCFSLYEDGIENAYAGSSGLDIPPEEKKELAKLKNYLK